MTNVHAVPTRLANVLFMDAFNLWPGATFVCDPNPDPSLPDKVKDLINPDADEVWVVTNVERDLNNERVYVWARRGDVDAYTVRQSFDFDFCERTAIVGNVVNVNDPEDNNWGSESSYDPATLNRTSPTWGPWGEAGRQGD